MVLRGCEYEAGGMEVVLPEVRSSGLPLDFDEGEACSGRVSLQQFPLDLGILLLGMWSPGADDLP
jgi:hypothetical protein